MAAAAATPQLHEDYYPSGNIARRYETVNGKTHGTYVRWYERGQLMCRASWNAGELLFTEQYYENGSIAERSDIVNGVYETWQPDGQLAWRNVLAE